MINKIIREGDEYTVAAIWANENGARIVEIEPDEAGRRFKIVPVPEPTIEEKNEQIKLQRQSRFATESDPLYLDYVEAQARGDETVDEKKQIWLGKKDEIRAELPYVVATKKRKKASA